MSLTERELKALAREIAEERQISMNEALKLAKRQILSLSRLARQWDETSETQRPRRPPTA